MCKRFIRRLFPSCLLVLASGAACAAPAEQAPPPAGCTDAEYRRLDFKLGEFEVTGIGGARAGESRTESVLGGCLLVEHWRGAISGEGRAHMFFDKAEGRWHLVYLTDDGATLYLAGTFAGDALVLLGENDIDDLRGLHRMSFSPLPGGGSRQFWELSEDGGRNWRVVHEGIYAPRR